MAVATRSLIDVQYVVNILLHVAGESTRALPISYELRSTPYGVCITCTFIDSTLADCLVVVHQRISQLSSSGLMNIESSHKFNRSGDTAYGCIETNLEEYQIGLVDGTETIPQGTHTYSTTSDRCITCYISPRVLILS